MIGSDFLKLDKQNPHYFSYKGKPKILITTSEHYGAVMNLRFEYVPYLDMLKNSGFNLTRLFLFYREQPGSVSGLEAKDDLYFSEIGTQNTLAPDMDTYICPWQRSIRLGNFDGGNLFDLDKWDEDYFERLKDFCKCAADRDIIVEVTLFSQYYNGGDCSPWKVSPLNIINNINGIGNIEYFEFTGMIDKKVVSVLENLVQKVVGELQGFSNIYYEICNEPNPFPHEKRLEYSQIAEWQNHFTHLIAEFELNFENKHLIAICDPNEHIDLSHISVCNFHYEDMNSEHVKLYYNLNKCIGNDETLTGILKWNQPMDYESRRKEAWQTILRGSSIYDYLDFTIATDDPIGAGLIEFPYEQYYNGDVMRIYLKNLISFMDDFDFANMAPDKSVIKSSYLVAEVDVLVEKGKAYAIYIYGSSCKYLKLDLPVGEFTLKFYNPRSGISYAQKQITAVEGYTVIDIPLYEQDIALSITKSL